MIKDKRQTLINQQKINAASAKKYLTHVEYESLEKVMEKENDVKDS
jgi:hypothetical protein